MVIKLVIHYLKSPIIQLDVYAGCHSCGLWLYFCSLLILEKMLTFARLQIGSYS